MLRKCLLILLTLCAASSEANEEKRPIRIYADIVGDLFHMGHVEMIKQARLLGDEMVIGVLSDETVESYKRTPIMTLKERVAIIEACKYVDEVIIDPPLRTTKAWLEEHQIDLVVHGDDISEEMLLDQYQVPIEMGIMRIVHYTPEISTTDLIDRIQNRIIYQLVGGKND